MTAGSCLNSSNGGAGGGMFPVLFMHGTQKGHARFGNSGSRYNNCCELDYLECTVATEQFLPQVKGCSARREPSAGQRKKKRVRSARKDQQVHASAPREVKEATFLPSLVNQRPQSLAF
ncbi:hypothetical protein DIPPA_22855 [Diplonema papillatum]|nr:hypothetical protein DIPPA_22855 [Diplonema papillatum]